MTAPEGRLDLVLNGPNGVWAYDPRTGKENWHIERNDPKQQAKFGEPIPVSRGDLLVALSGRPGPCQAFRVGSGTQPSVELTWEIRRKGRDVASPLIWGDHLYVADSKAVLTCYDLKTGRALYTQRLAADAKVLASPVAIAGKLLFPLDTGETVVLEPGAKFKVAGRNVLGDHQSLDFGASPAIVAGRLYLRSQRYLYCIEDKK
jgi:outer membrane protein assembly factor BamB